MPTAHYALSGTQAGALASRMRLLRRRRVLTAHQAALLDTLLWSARKPGSATLTASLSSLATIAGQGRRTVARGIARLEELGLIQRIRRRVRLAWGGSIASRVIANAYCLIAPDTECQRDPAREQPSRIYLAETPMMAVQAAQGALEQRRKAMEARLKVGRRGAAA